ncbi:MAG: alcohol dehydrogenase catalytic domain-containing protein [Burkholderiales bacterium]|nr:alcohol dehydrogenase catalytic domain-containing protein [Burkholderiales bacterium]
MKALVYTAPNEMTYREEPEPTLADGEVVLKIDAVGICGSDMHAYHGHDPRRNPPLVLGHEFCGTIVAGPGKGTRVTGNPLITCGTCEYCVQGRNNLCANRTMVGMTRARPLPELTLYIIGGGAIGLLMALLVRSYGCRDVILAETNPLRRASAAKAAGCRVFDPLAGGGPADNSIDLVIDAVGGKATRKAALAAVKPGGVVLHIGLQDWASEIDMRKLTLAEITLIGTYTYSTADLRATVKALHEGAFGDLAWVETRDLADGARAFADLDKGRSAAAKIVLTPS